MLGRRAIEPAELEQLIDKLLNPEDIDILKEIYFENFPVIADDVETRIWNSLLKKPSNGITIFDTLLFSETTQEEILRFIVFWMHTINNECDVIEAFNKMNTSLSNPDYLFSLCGYEEDIKTIAKLRIMAINQEVKLTNSEEKKIKKFLHSAEPFSFHFFSKKPHTLHDIYKMMHDHKPEAIQIYSEKCASLEKEINEKLTNDLGHPTHFCFK